jgi:hypothetical protein
VKFHRVGALVGIGLPQILSKTFVRLLDFEKNEENPDKFEKNIRTSLIELHDLLKTKFNTCA